MKDNDADMIKHISQTLSERQPPEQAFVESKNNLSERFAVMILLGFRAEDDRPCLILNKRSMKVAQAGDLCCPGGRFSSGLDTAISKIVTLPGFPMAKWPSLTSWRKEHPHILEIIKLFFSTSLRESVEEMFLNPFGVNFLGPQVPLTLELTGRIIYPMIGWTNQKKFRPNWEVERIVYIPLENLMETSNYGRCRLQIMPELASAFSNIDEEFPCFVHRGRQGTELLWGITYRMVNSFLEIISDFVPPDLASLPVFYKQMDKHYMNGIQ